MDSFPVWVGISDPGSASDPQFRLVPAPEKYSKSSDGKDQWLREVRGQRQQRQTKGGPTPADPRSPTTEPSTTLTQHLKAFTSYLQSKGAFKNIKTFCPHPTPHPADPPFYSLCFYYSIMTVRQQSDPGNYPRTPHHIHTYSSHITHFTVSF